MTVRRKPTATNPVAHRADKRLRAAAEDITARKRDEQLLALEHAISRSFPTGDTKPALRAQNI